MTSTQSESRTSTHEAAAARAYVWGFPLVVMHRTRSLLCSRVGLGTFNHRDGLATASDRAVVAPNNDTLYSTAWFDLSAGDLRIDVPPMDRPDRYWSVMLLDAFTNVAYVSRRTHGVEGTSVTVTLDHRVEPVEGSPTLTMGTPTVWALVRVLVDGPDDLEAARASQRSITITAPAGHPTHRTEPAGRPDAVHDAGAGFFAELRAALAVDPPAAWHPDLDAEAAAIVAGSASLSPDELAAGVAAGERQLRSHGVGTDREANGWGTRQRGCDFGDDVLRRACAAKFTLAGHHPAENRSYIAQVDAEGAPLDGSKALELTFPSDGHPPCAGFWSLTVYAPDMFFHPNPIDRYAVGDRTGLAHSDNGDLTITIGGPEPADPTNWLPAPDGPYRLGLRVYEGHPGVVDATWFPPPLQPAR